jgi:methyl-accepting chemotaxis protein
MALKVAQKIQMLAAGTVGAFLVLTIAETSTVNTVQDANRELVNHELPQIAVMTETETLMLNVRRNEKDMLINTGNSTSQKKYFAEFKENEAKLKEHTAKIVDFTSQDKDFSPEDGNSAKDLQNNINQYFESAAPVLQAHIESSNAQILETNTKLENAKKSFHDAETKISALSPKVSQNSKHVLLRVESSVARAKFVAILMGLSFAAAVLIASLILARSVKKPLEALTEGSKRFAIGDVELSGLNIEELRSYAGRTDELGEMAKAFLDVMAYQKEKILVANEVAKGNLNIDIRQSSDHDTLGKALQQMHGNLNSLVLQLRTTADQVAHGSAQVSTASQALAKGATSQAATLEEISAAVTEMNSQAKKNAENAVDASQSASGAQIAAEEGKLKIETTVTAMNDISTASQQISKVIKLIDDIAFQTNLLALNAAVEAARAGRHGKGFAVVADEVRNLASRSAKAARETSELIESSLSKVDNGVKQAQSTAESFVSINSGVTQMSSALSSIVDSSNAQAGSAHEIAQGLNNVNNVTQQNTAAAEENAAASQQMTGMADQLKNIVSRFTVKSGTISHTLSHTSAPSPVAHVSKAPAAPAKATPPTPAPKAPTPAVKAAAPIKTPSRAPAAAPAAPAAPKPAPVPHKGASPIISTGDTHASKGWGGTNKDHIPIVRPEEVLALDDDEFGKY